MTSENEETLGTLRGPTHYEAHNGDVVVPEYDAAENPPRPFWARSVGLFSWIGLHVAESVLHENGLRRDSEIAFEVYDDEE